MEQNEEKANEATTEIKKSIIKKILKFVSYMILIIIGINLLLYILLSIPAIQNKLLDYATNMLKDKLKSEVSIDEIRLKLLLNASVDIKGVYVEDLSKDTLLYAKEVTASVSLLKLLGGKLDMTAQGDGLVAKINKKDSISDFNFQFIVDAFSSADTTATDTTASSFVISIRNIDIKNSRLHYDILSDSTTPGLFNSSHIAVNNLNIDIDLNSIDLKKLDVQLHKLSGIEQSGLTIESLKGSVTSSDSLIMAKGLSLNLPKSHLNISNAQYNTYTQLFDIETNDTEISPQDLVAFMPNLKYLTDNISLKTKMKGTLPQVMIEELLLSYGQNCALSANASIANYTRYGSSDIRLAIEKFRITPAGIASLAKLGDPEYVNPDVLNNMGEIFMKGLLKGKLSRLSLASEIWSRQGSIIINSKGAIDSTFNNFNINASISTLNFALDNLLGRETGLGKLTLHADLSAKQTKKSPLSAELKGAMDQLFYNNNEIKDLSFEGHYNSVDMAVKLSGKAFDGNINATASMTQEKDPTVKFDLDASNLQVNQFYKQETWNNPRLSLCINGSVKSTDIDKMVGAVYIDSLDLRDNGFRLQPGRISLELSRTSDADKLIALKSSIISGTIQGDYKFGKIVAEFSDMMNSYLPEVFPVKKKMIKKENNFNFNFTINNTEQISSIFSLPVSFIDQGKVNGTVDLVNDRMTLKASLPHIKSGESDIENINFSLSNNATSFSMTGDAGMPMEEGKYTLALNIDGRDNSIDTHIDFGSINTKTTIKGAMDAIIQFSRNEKKELVSQLNILPSDVAVGNLTVSLLPAQIINWADRTEISDVGISMNKKKYFGVNGVISPNKSDSIKIYFDHAQISDVLAPFEINNIKACFDGDVFIYNALDQPEIHTKGFIVEDMIIFSDTLGTMTIDSEWSNTIQAMRINAVLEHMGHSRGEICGEVFTRKDSLDMAITLDKLPMNWIQPFAAEYVNMFSGTMSMGVNASGKISAPIVQGYLGFNNTKVGIDYTNVTYIISDTILINPNKIGLDNLELRDIDGNRAIVNATVTHKNFKDLQYSLNMKMTNLMVLNTQHRTDSLFYGKLYANGDVNIKGNDKGIKMTMNMQNGKNSLLNVLIPQTEEATDYKSVVYINVPPEKLPKEEQKVVLANATPPISMGIKLRLDPNIALQVIIDPNTGDNMYVKGNGTIDFSYDLETETMRAFGDYTVSDGSVRVNLQGLKNFEFKIQNGSKLKFIGDPLKTNFDITAYRRVRADLKTLDQSFEAESGSSRIPVDCILGIKGNMDKMTLTYNIKLAEANDEVQRKLNSLIVTEEQKLRQFAYLIATGSFYSSSTNVADGMLTSMAATTISGGLNAVLGNVLGDKWEVGTNIDTGNGSSDMSVSVSTRLLDDKLKLNTNIGYRTDEASNNTFVGDFDAEYQLTKLWSLRAFNRTNNRYYTQAPTTQGIGVQYTKEASTLKRLFQSFKPRFRRKDQNGQIISNDSTVRQDSTKQISTPKHIHKKENTEDKAQVKDSLNIKPDTTEVKKSGINSNKAVGITEGGK